MEINRRAFFASAIAFVAALLTRKPTKPIRALDTEALSFSPAFVYDLRPGLSLDQFRERYLRPAAERFQREQEIEAIKSLRGFYDPHLAPRRLPS